MHTQGGPKVYKFPACQTCNLRIRLDFWRNVSEALER